MVYFTIIMIISACLLYGALLCFIWSEKAAEYTTSYVRDVKDEDYANVRLQWDVLQQILDGTSWDPKSLGNAMKKSAAAAGGFCLLAIFLNLLCAHCSAMLMGYKYTARKTVVFINLTGFVIGILSWLLLLDSDLPAAQAQQLSSSHLCPRRRKLG